MARKEEGEGKLVILVGVVCFGFGKEVPGIEVIDAFGACGAVFGDRFLCRDGGIEGHNERCELDFTGRVSDV